MKNKVFTLVKEYNIDGTIDIDVNVFSNPFNAANEMEKAASDFKDTFGKDREIKIDKDCHLNGMFIYAVSDDYYLDMKIEEKNVK